MAPIYRFFFKVQYFCQQLISEGKIDFLDISLWDCFKEPEEEEYTNKNFKQSGKYKMQTFRLRLDNETHDINMKPIDGRNQ